MQIIKYAVVVKNIFGRVSQNIYYPSSNEEYWNFTQNLVDSVDVPFFIQSVDDSNVYEYIYRGFPQSTSIRW